MMKMFEVHASWQRCPDENRAGAKRRARFPCDDLQIVQTMAAPAGSCRSDRR